MSITLVAALKQIVEHVEKEESNCCFSIKETTNEIITVLDVNLEKFNIEHKTALTQDTLEKIEEKFKIK